MSPYQGLFYLSLGIICFLLLLFGFKLLAISARSKQGGRIPQTAAWRGQKALRVLGIKEETADIRVISLARIDGEDFPSFEAGQFLSIHIGDDPKLLRSYSMCSSATNQKVVKIAVKKIPDGVGSAWAHELKVGDTIMAHPPSGLFTDTHADNQQRVYIAGGIGITPILSMIATHVECAQNVPMVVFYGMRTEQDMAFHDQLSLYAKHHKNITYVPIVSSPSPDWRGASGYLSYKLMTSQATIEDDAHFFLCGPTVMTDTVIDDLSKAGIDLDQIHIEKFASPASFDRSALPDRHVTITYNGVNIAYEGKQTILECLEERGQHLPFACRVGVCGSCKCEAKGKIFAITDAGLTAAEKKAGLILPCVAFPEEDLELKNA